MDRANFRPSRFQTHGLPYKYQQAKGPIGTIEGSSVFLAKNAVLWTPSSPCHDRNLLGLFSRRFPLMYVIRFGLSLK